MTLHILPAIATVALPRRRQLWHRTVLTSFLIYPLSVNCWNDISSCQEPSSQFERSLGRLEAPPVDDVGPTTFLPIPFILRSVTSLFEICCQVQYALLSDLKVMTGETVRLRSGTRRKGLIVIGVFQTVITTKDERQHRPTHLRKSGTGSSINGPCPTRSLQWLIVHAFGLEDVFVFTNSQPFTYLRQCCTRSHTP